MYRRHNFHLNKVITRGNMQFVTLQWHMRHKRLAARK